MGKLYGRPITHHTRAGCHNCKHRYRKDEYQEYELYCHLDGSFRPLNGSSVEPDEQFYELCREIFFDDIVHVDYRGGKVCDPLWHSAVQMYEEAWFLWADAHRVHESDICSEWAAEDEDWED